MNARKLTPRQEQVAWLVLEGLTNKAIAKRLEVSEANVKMIVLRVFRKKGVSARAQFLSKYAHLIVEQRKQEEAT